MDYPDLELVSTFGKLGVEFEPPRSIVGARKLQWAEIDTPTLRHIRRIMGADAPQELIDELRRRGNADAA